VDSELCAIWLYPAFKQLRPGVNSLVWFYIGSTAFRWFVWLSIYVVCMRKLFFGGLAGHLAKISFEP